MNDSQLLLLRVLRAQAELRKLTPHECHKLEQLEILECQALFLRKWMLHNGELTDEDYTEVERMLNHPAKPRGGL